MKFWKKPFNRLLCLILWNVGSFQTFAQGSLAASPARLFYDGAAGQGVTQSVRLSNSGTTPMIVKASLQDWERDSLGTKVYYPAGQLKRSNAAWLKISPEIVELAPGQEKDVLVTMSVPAGAEKEGLKNSMLFFTQVNEQKATARKGQKQVLINIRFEVGIHVYYTPPALTKKELKIIAFKDKGQVTTSDGLCKRLALVVENAGEVSTEAKVHFEVTDASSGEEFKFPDRAIAMLPGTKQIIYMDVPAKYAGRKLLAVAMIDSGVSTELKVAEKAFDYVR